jgi:cardiolipin synthase
MIDQHLVNALKEARRHISESTWELLSEAMLTMDDLPAAQVIGFVRTQIPNAEAAWFMSVALESWPHQRWSMVGSAMMTVDHLVGHDGEFMEYIWSGPSNGRFPVRRIDQVLYDLIANAQHRIFLVTFAAYKVDHLCYHLARAIERNVEVTMLLESESQSDGQLTADALRAFSALPLKMVKVLYWPLEKRERNQAGRPGKLHAKSAIVDDVAIIGSANLTDDAFNRNMELGVYIKDPVKVAQLLAHFAEMEKWGALRRLEFKRT